ncbi:tyrosine-type recombinase/integrase [Oceanobacillus damuensis]|uniref:tyrosine-type recombinase/integrase n=1 Tax=Oceanobacillus damuensis TaxID=937928 RepID=UPI0008362268|nr:tyrosine-type recombinase/integrase [Oceanobacillus damuensis]
MGISFRQHKDKKWEYRVKIKDPITKKYKEKSKRGFRTKPEARFEAQKVEKDLLEGFDMSETSLYHFLDFWMEEYKKDTVRKNTYLTLQNSIENHIKPYFRELVLKELTPELYQKFLNHLDEKDLAYNTIKKIHNALTGAMNRAVINKKVQTNPCSNAVFKAKEIKEDVKFIDSSKINLFLTNAYEYGYIYWIFFKLLIETGMRKGEAGALQWSDINFKDLTITINKSLDFQASNESELFGETKNYNSKRVISISKSLSDDLRFHARWQNQNKTMINDLYHHELNLVLCRKDGNFMPKSSLFNAFSRILKRSGIKPLPIHSLRHTHAVLLLEAGADMKYIQKRLGHGSYQITADIYSHVSNKINQKNTAQFESYLNDILK